MSSCGKKKILVVDDDKQILAMFNALLGNHYDLTTADNLGEALSALGGRSFSVVITDLQLSSGMPPEGLDVVRFVRQSEMPSGIIVMSGGLTGDMQKQALLLGADQCYAKPFDIEKMIASINRMAGSPVDAGKDVFTANPRAEAGKISVSLPRRKKNCWEFMLCGREPGGHNKSQGVCPAAGKNSLDGVHGGVNGGRSCWVILGTGPDGRESRSLMDKFCKCGACPFYRMVAREESPYLIEDSLLLIRLRQLQPADQPPQKQTD